MLKNMTQGFEFQFNFLSHPDVELFIKNSFIHPQFGLIEQIGVRKIIENIKNKEKLTFSFTNQGQITLGKNTERVTVVSNF